MDERQKAELKAKVAGRTAANELADLYVSQSATLYKQFGEHGEAASVAFLETLRDALVAVRPFPKEDSRIVSRTSLVPSVPRQQAAWGDRWDWDQDPPGDRFVFVEFGERISGETDKAVKLGDLWVPKSQMPETPPNGKEIGWWPVTKWWAEKNDLAYEERG